MPTLSARLIRIPALAVSSLLLLTACGGGNSDPGPVATNPGPVRPGPPTPTQAPPPPAQPGPETPADPAAAPEPVLADAHTGLVEATITSQPAWNAWVAPPNRATVSGVGCLVSEEFHQHSLVSIYKNGVRLGLPENIGRSGCAYELHTHDVTGCTSRPTCRKNSRWASSSRCGASRWARTERPVSARRCAST